MSQRRASSTPKPAASAPRPCWPSAMRPRAGRPPAAGMPGLRARHDCSGHRHARRAIRPARDPAGLGGDLPRSARRPFPPRSPFPAAGLRKPPRRGSSRRPAARRQAEEDRRRRHHAHPRTRRRGAGQGHGRRLERTRARPRSRSARPTASSASPASARPARARSTATGSGSATPPIVAVVARRRRRNRVPATVPGRRDSSVGADVGHVTIAAACRITDREVAIEAVVTAPATLLDATGRRIVVQDGSGAIEVLCPRVRRRRRFTSSGEGRIGVAYGAPRLRPTTSRSAAPARFRRRSSSTVAGRRRHEWRLVTVSGRVESVHKLGDRWRAEIARRVDLVPVVGQPGSGIAVTTARRGRTATVDRDRPPALPERDRPPVLDPAPVPG